MGAAASHTGARLSISSQIVELGGQQHLLGVVEGAGLEIQAGFQLVDLVEVIEVAESVEREGFR